MLNRTSVRIVAMLVLLALGAPARAEPPGAVPPEATLLDILKSNAALDEKAEACRQLERVGTKDAVPLLAGLLSHEQLSHKARMVLEQIKDPSVDDALRDAISKLQGRRLAGVVQSIGRRRDASAEEAVTRLLKGPDAEVASAAAYALGLIGSASAAGSLEQAMAGASDELKPALWDALLRAGDALMAKGQQPAAVGLYDRLRTGEVPAHVQAAAARGAVLARQADGVTLLPDLLADRRWTIFNLALRLTVELQGDAVTRTVAAQLAGLPAERQGLVISALAGRGDKSALPAIQPFLRSTTTALRIAAIRAVSQLQDKASLPALLEAASTPDPSVAEAAMAALVRLPGNEVDAAMVEWVNGTDTARSLAGIDGLAKRQSASAGSALLKATTAADAQVRLSAIKALGDIGTAGELRPLVSQMLKATGAERDALEQAVVAICSTSREKDACETVAIAALAESTAPVQKAAMLRILSGVGGARSLQALRGAAADVDAELQETAIRGLCNWPTADVAPDLMRLARDAAKPAHRVLALRGWLRLAGDARQRAEDRMEMCAQAAPLIQRPEEKRQLLAALSAIPTLRSLAMIAPFLDDVTVKEEACSAAVTLAATLAPSTPADVAAAIQIVEKARQTTRNTRTAQQTSAILARLKQSSGK